MNCACKTHCGDVPEHEDDPRAVCKGLPYGLAPPPLLCPRGTPGCTRTNCSAERGHSCYGPNAPMHIDMSDTVDYVGANHRPDSEYNPFTLRTRDEVMGTEVGWFCRALEAIGRAIHRTGGFC